MAHRPHHQPARVARIKCISHTPVTVRVCHGKCAA